MQAENFTELLRVDRVTALEMCLYFKSCLIELKNSASSRLTEDPESTSIWVVLLLAKLMTMHGRIGLQQLVLQI